ncbi:hypothetical protein DFH29DRAFT_1015714 [Suillus ampliporus]|nr:hypothetical protein DFH29DRAFT_1015714 [Suillus ampliporus]
MAHYARLYMLSGTHLCVRPSHSSGSCYRIGHACASLGVNTEASVSIPNLSAAAHGKQPSQLITKPVAGTERRLSAEMWCDALFFPRPRLKVKRAHGRFGGSSGRIVSPPVADGAPPRLGPALLSGRPRVMSTTYDAPREHHVSVKSRSAVDVVSGPSISGHKPQTRSLSRARARSLSRSHGRPGHKPEGSTALEFVAARTLLGSQSIAPTVNVASTPHSRSYSHSHNCSHSRTRYNSYSFTHSHTHAYSLGHSNSQKSSTDPQSTRHARNESWGRTALLKACAPCGDRSDVLNSPVGGKRLDLEPMTENTKVIHSSDPAEGSHNGAGDGCVIIGISPGPSTLSGEGVGIALSSPPSDDDSRLSSDPNSRACPVIHIHRRHIYSVS